MTTKPERVIINRRTFLRMTSAAVAGSALFGTDPFGGLMFRAAEAALNWPDKLPVSLGYWKGSEFWDDLNTLPRNWTPEAVPFLSDIVPAGSLPEGETRFIREGARITIHGLLESEETGFASCFRELSVYSAFDIVDKGRVQTIRCHVWNFHALPVPNVGSPMSFFAPLNRSCEVRFVLEGTGEAVSPLQHPSGVQPSLKANGNGEGAAFSGSIGLVAGCNPFRAKLRRGVYIAALSHDPRWLPAWNRSIFQPSDPDIHKDTIYRNESSKNRQPFPVDYFVFSIGYAV